MQSTNIADGLVAFYRATAQNTALHTKHEIDKSTSYAILGNIVPGLLMSLFIASFNKCLCTSKSQSKSWKAVELGIIDVSWPLSTVPTKEKVKWRMWLFSRERFFFNNIASNWNENIAMHLDVEPQEVAAFYNTYNLQTKKNIDFVQADCYIRSGTAGQSHSHTHAFLSLKTKATSSKPVTPRITLKTAKRHETDINSPNRKHGELKRLLLDFLLGISLAPNPYLSKKKKKKLVWKGMQEQKSFTNLIFGHSDGAVIEGIHGRQLHFKINIFSTSEAIILGFQHVYLNLLLKGSHF